MSRFFMKGSVLEESEKIMMNIPGFRYSNKLDSCVLEVIGYSQLVKKLQRNRFNSHYQFQIRNLIKNFDGELFLSARHKSQFYSVFENNSVDNVETTHLAVVFLLSANGALWKLTETETDSYRCVFQKIRLRSIDVGAYILYKMAKSFGTDQWFGHFLEIEEDKLVQDSIFKAIINSMLIERYGSELLKAEFVS